MAQGGMCEKMKFNYTYRSRRYCLLNKEREWRDANLATHAEDFPRITVTLAARRRSVGILANRRARRKGVSEKR